MSPDAEPVGIFQQLLDGLAEQAGLVDAETGTILAINDAWEASTSVNRLTSFKPGFDYFGGLARLAAEGHPRAQAILDAVMEMRRGERTSFRLVYDGVGFEEGQTFETRISLLNAVGQRYLRVTRYDLTELSDLRHLRDEFNLSLLEAQEGERRRMGRELHDSGMQLLASLGLSLARLKHLRPEIEETGITGDMEKVLVDVQREFRSISFLAHPPQVERLGLVQALQDLVEGFGARAGLAASFALEGSIGDLPPTAARTVFRVVQEAVSNVHRHARARRLTVRLIGRRWALHVLIADDGRGIPADLHHGVGLISMRARMQELGGRLAIRGETPGTLILASLPVREPEGIPSE
jgi:two-component system NarL family sensor kinase